MTAVTVNPANFIFKDKDGNVGYLNSLTANDITKIKAGVPVYDATATYSLGYVVRNGTHVYQAIQASSSSDPHATSDTAYWRELADTSLATTTAAGLVELATDNEVTSGTAGVIPDAAQVKSLVDAQITVEQTMPATLASGKGVITPQDDQLDSSLAVTVPQTGLAYAIAATPNWFRRKALPTPNKTSITIPAGMQVNINDVGYILTTARTLNLDDLATAANRAGKDVYIYACTPTSGLEPDLVLSLNSTVPDGYTAATSRKIGGFHCLCVSVGTISGHTLSGYVAGDILPASVWDLLHRAASNNEGMVYDPRGFWVDIYLPSWDGTKLVSEYGGTIVDGTSTKAMHGEMFAEYFPKVGKRLHLREEFISFAEGSNQGTHIYGDADPDTTGGHKDTASRRMISNLGVEDCCGALWQWSGDTYESWAAKIDGTATSINWAKTNGATYLSGMGWQDDLVVYNSALDSEKRGSCYALLRRGNVGANWDDAAPRPGSRAFNANNFGVNVNANNSARGVSRYDGGEAPTLEPLTHLQLVVPALLIRVKHEARVATEFSSFRELYGGSI